MTTTIKAYSIYWRTGKGAKAHRDSHCANYRRSLHTGDVFQIPAAEIQGWAGCMSCCTAEDHAFLAKGPAAPAAPAKCANSGVVKPGRIYSDCKDCGKNGKVNRKTGKITAHLPLTK